MRAKEADAISRVCIHCGHEIEPHRKPLRAGWLCSFCHQWQDEAMCPTCGQKTMRARLGVNVKPTGDMVGAVVAAIMPDIVNLVRSKLAEESRP